MALAPIYVGAPKVGSLAISTANTNRDGTGLTGSNDVVAGGASGSRIDRVMVKATVTTTPGMIRFYLYDGTNHRLLTELFVNAQTPGAVSPTFEQELIFENGLVLPSSSYILRAAPHNAEMFHIVAFGGDF